MNVRIVSASTCIAAHHRCERSDTCKWHLSEVEIRCTGQCNRQLCAAVSWYDEMINASQYKPFLLKLLNKAKCSLGY